MNNPIAIAIAAGLVSGLAYSALLVQVPFAILLFYLAPLPVAVATLRFGWSRGVLAAVAGAFGTSLALGLAAAAFYLATSALPMVWLGRLVMLSRPTASPAAPPAGPARLEDQGAEWYPPGRIVVWTAGLAGGLAFLATVLLGIDSETFSASVRELADALLAARPDLAGPIGADGVEGLVDVLVVALLPATSIMWLLVMLFNLWLGARILRGMGVLGRPWPSLRRIEYPAAAPFAFLGAMLLSFAPGFVGTVAPAVAAAFLAAYVLLGLAVLHCAVAQAPGRTVLLLLAYGAIVLLVWPALIVAILGLGEPMFRLRARALASGRVRDDE